MTAAAKRGPPVVWTADLQVPWSADDPEMNNGYRSVLIPPTADDDWVVWDSSKRRYTGWIWRTQWGRA
jgi:hypothetical protein